MVSNLKPGTHERASEVVSRALLDQGATNLQAKLGSHIASRGATCWESDTRVGRFLVRWDGRPYHRESIGRARRQMKKRGWIASTRIFPQQTPPGAKHRSTYGTTSKYINWKTLGVRDPSTRWEKREAKNQQQQADRAGDYTPRRRHAHISIDPGLAALVEGLGAASVASAASSPPPARRPVDRQRQHQGDVEARAADARARLAVWARDNEPRGPP